METILVTKSIFLWIIILKCLISHLGKGSEYNHVLMLLFQLL